MLVRIGRITKQQLIDYVKELKEADSAHIGELLELEDFLKAQLIESIKNVLLWDTGDF